MKKEKVNISPDVCLYNSEDEKNLIIEFQIPGVQKDDIDLRMQDDSFTLRAPRGDVEYSISEILCCPINSKETRAEYKDGLLVVHAPYKDQYENAVRVKIA